MTNVHIVKRKSFCIWIRNHFDHESCRSIMFSDEKWFDQDGQYNRQNNRIYAVSRQETEYMGTWSEHKCPFKVMVWIGVFSGLIQVVILPQKTTFDSDFYVEKVLPIVKRDGIKLIGENFIFRVLSHTRVDKLWKQSTFFFFSFQSTRLFNNCTWKMAK